MSFSDKTVIEGLRDHLQNTAAPVGYTLRAVHAYPPDNLAVAPAIVINAVVWDGVTDWTPPEGTTVELAPAHVGIGWTRVDGEWVAPVPPAPPAEDPNKVSARAKLAALGLTEAEIAALVG